MLKKALEKELSEKESKELFSAFDQIGDIVIVRIPTAKSVFYQSSSVAGDFRTRDLKLIAGEDKTETEYKEFGCRFVVDVKKAFFSPRLSTERDRISSLVKDGEIVINMFGGVGMFSIIAAKKKKCTVYNIDINPDAVKLCQKNIKLNKLAGAVISLQGDAAQIIKEQLENKGDRVLMLLPERADEFLSSAINATKSEGIIHYYSHIHADKKTEAPELSEKHFKEICPVTSKILNSKLVRAVGPRYYQTVVDVKITK